MQAQHQINAVADADNYIARLHKLPTKFAQNIEGLKIREQKQIIPPAFVIERVLEEMQNFVDTPVQDNILYSSLLEKLDKLEDLAAPEKQRVLDEASAAITASVYPAYQALIDYTKSLEGKAGNDHGFWHLPNGEQAYQQALAFFTTTDYTPQQIHQIGLEEVARIQAEMLLELGKLNVNTAQSFKQVIHEFSEQGQILLPGYRCRS